MNEQSGADAGEATLRAARELRPAIIAARDEIEQGRRLPLHLVDAMKKAGMFRMPMPRDWGGPELDPVTQLRVIEELSIADASVGWCAMIGSDGGYFTGFMDQKVAREMYRDLDAVTAGALTLTGRAVRMKGGYRVSGRWPFASGCQHSTWLIGGCTVHDDRGPLVRPSGIPETRQCMLPTSDAEILDTWYTTGLRGSGSNDFALKDYFVPEEHTFSYQELTFYRTGGLYRLPLNILYKFAAPALGVARAAIDALIEAGEKPARLTTIGGKMRPPHQLRDEEYVQRAAGKAEAMLCSARSWLFELTAEVYDVLCAGKRLSPRLAARYLSVHTYVYDTCAQAVQLVYKARGGSAVYTSGPLDRCLRDALTMNEHAAASVKFYHIAGRMLLGLPGEEFLF